MSINDSIARVIKEEGGFQNSPNDSGNYFNGVLIGTKYGITPNAYFDFYKKVPTLDTIKNLSVAEAVPIYKIKYADKIRASEIANTSVMELMLFSVVNSGAGQIKSFKQLMNEVAGKKIVTVNAVPFTSAEVKLLNSLPQDRYFNALKKYREAFYKALVEKKPSNSIFLKGWLNRLNKHVYSGKKSTPKGLYIFGGLALFGLGAWAGYRLG